MVTSLEEGQAVRSLSPLCREAPPSPFLPLFHEECDNK